MTDQDRPGTVIEHGADIHFTDDQDVHPADYVRILPNGYVEAITRASYQVDYYPPHKVQGVHTHTTDEQERDILGVDPDA